MKVCGIVAEYNPFHSGHKYHIEETRRLTYCDAVVAVMSGCFVQRGEPAIFDKWTRAASAIRGGADLVVELPAYFSLKSAEGFAEGSVRILNALGINLISFGSECGNIDDIISAAEILSNETGTFKELLREKLAEGLPFAAAREAAMSAVAPHLSKLLAFPNNTLSVEYIKAIKKTNPSITTVTVKRSDSGYNSYDANGDFASATALRKMIIKGMDVSRFMPSPDGCRPLTLEDYEDVALHAVLTADNSCIADTAALCRILSASAPTLSALLENAKAKNFHMARIKRALINLMIGNRLPENLAPSYIRVLAMNKKGAALIRSSKSETTLPIITKPSHYSEDDPIWALENTATDIYFLPLRRGKGLNLTTSPIVVK